MALISCPQCGKQISDKAPRCPHCGLDLSVSPVPQENNTPTTPKKKTKKVWIAVVAGLMGVVLVVAALWFFLFKDSEFFNKGKEPNAVVESGKTTEPQKENTSRKSAAVFPYNTTFTGTVGSKCTLIIDNNGGGSYTYDLKGQPITRSIKLKSYNKTTGQLLIEGYDPKGQYIGVFDGYTSNNTSYDGTFTNYKGGAVGFKLSTTGLYVVINATELRLRFGPSLDAETFKWGDGTNRHPNKGEKFRYLGESGEFYLIDYKGHELWVSKQYTYLE